MNETERGLRAALNNSATRAEGTARLLRYWRSNPRAGDLSTVLDWVETELAGIAQAARWDAEDTYPPAQ